MSLHSSTVLDSYRWFYKLNSSLTNNAVFISNRHIHVHQAFSVQTYTQPNTHHAGISLYPPPKKKTNNNKKQPAYSILCKYNPPTVSAWILQRSTSHSQHYHYHFHQHDHQTVMHVKLKTNGCKHEEKNYLSHSNKNYYKDNGITGALCHQAPRSPKAFAL